GDYNRKKIYNENALEVAKQFEDAGLRYLHLVDLDGAKSRRVVNWKVVEAIAGHTRLTLDFGGGITTEEEIQRLFDLGARQINLRSIAVRKPEQVEEWLAKWGSEKIILSADVRGHHIAISGWTEESSITIDDLLADYTAKGITYVTCTDISTDGMLTGPNVALYTRLLERFANIKLVASGGVSGTGDLHNLKATGVDGVIIGKAIYEGKITLADLAGFVP